MSEKNADSDEPRPPKLTPEEFDAIASRIRNERTRGPESLPGEPLADEGSVSRGSPGAEAGAAGGSGGLGEEPEDRLEDHLDLLLGVPLTLRIELGRTRMAIEEVLKLGRGSVVTLDRLAGDPVNIFVNDRLVARGEVVIANGNFCVRVAEILLPRERA